MHVPTFLMDELPVTEAQYGEYVAETGAEPPTHWQGDQPPARGLDRPVVGISLAQARAYAAWRGARLPTPQEWELAARGPEGLRFPWGDGWDASRCVCPESGHSEPQPVGSCPTGVSPCGCQDMVGNVWEWTDADGGQSSSVSALGGSFRHACRQLEGIARVSVPARRAFPYIGFRCAADPGSER